MLKRYVRVCAVICLIFCVAAGCSTKKGKGPGGIEPTAIIGEPVLPEGDFERDYTRIRDVSFENVMFAYDSYAIENSEISKIEQISAYMRRNANVKLVTEGNCDERGTKEYNVSLGENRAQAVRAHLIRLGIPSSNIQTKSYGEENPVDPGHNESAWRRNRRAEFALYR